MPAGALAAAVGRLPPALPPTPQVQAASGEAGSAASPSTALPRAPTSGAVEGTPPQGAAAAAPAGSAPPPPSAGPGAAPASAPTSAPASAPVALSPEEEETQRLEKMKRIRARVAAEIKSTEESYVASLDLIVKTIMPGFMDIMGDSDVQTVFSSLPILHKLNHMLLDNINDVMARWDQEEKMSKPFKSFASYFKMYSDYVSKHDQASDLIGSLAKNSSKYAKFLSTKMSEPALKGMDLASYLIMPIQRIPRYRLLLTELLKNMPKDHGVSWRERGGGGG